MMRDCAKLKPCYPAWKKLRDIHRWDTEIQLEIADEADLDADMEASTNSEITASTTIARLTALVDNYKKQAAALTGSTSRRSSSPTAARSSVRLPKLQLPSFTASYTEWTSFCDLFNATVESNTKLSESEKLNYLCSCVNDDAAKLISSITMTDAI